MFKAKFMISLMVFFSLATAVAQDEYFLDESSEENPAQLEENLDNLSGIEELDDIAVIQKKYLDKTGRFEVFGALNVVLNSQYFNIIGFNLTGSYHFSERWGVELQGMFLTDAEKSVTSGLRTDIFITTEDIVTPAAYYGANLRWSPIYGKMSLRERTINPFEVYFTLGGGITKTDDSQSAFTIHAGVGQVYPVTKNTTLRWGLGLHNFSANAKGNLKGDIQGQKVNASLLYLSVGMSMYFPFSDKR